jgi:hypothetical protein
VKVLAYAAILLAIAGCSRAERPATAYMPIPVTCKTPAPPEPQWKQLPPGLSLLPENQRLYVRVQVLLANAALHIGYETALLAWGGGCNPTGVDKPRE